MRLLPATESSSSSLPLDGVDGSSSGQSSPAREMEHNIKKVQELNKKKVGLFKV